MALSGLKDKVVLVIGGATRPGSLLAVDLAKQGARAVVLHGASAEELDHAGPTLAAIRAAGARVIPLASAVTSARALKNIFARVVEAVGPPDVALNAFIRPLDRPLFDTTEEDFDVTCALNTKSSFFFLKEAGLTVRDGGMICTVMTAPPNIEAAHFPAHDGTKAAIERYTRAAARECRARQISVTAISTAYADGSDAAGGEGRSSPSLPASGISQDEDIVRWVRYLITEGRWMSGQTLILSDYDDPA